MYYINIDWNIHKRRVLSVCSYVESILSTNTNRQIQTLYKKDWLVDRQIDSYITDLDWYTWTNRWMYFINIDRNIHKRRVLSVCLYVESILSTNINRQIQTLY